mmetsp:Transcript_7910/g.10998  ORF Transcript_7910/g.10998 Transcript_7910/m.10998 type:complete len:113 (-) Transcript_7910:16-354(-)
MHNDQDGFLNIGLALLQVYRMLFQANVLDELLPVDYVWTFILFTMMYLIFRYLLWNAFAAIVIEANYTVQLAHFRQGTAWRRKELRNWIVPALFFEMMRDILGDVSEPAAQS